MELIKPFFSIIIPTFNRAYVLPRVISSVLSQTFDNFELIVVVDGSTDDTLSVLNQIIDVRFSYLSQSNLGVSAARNSGARIALGSYLIFLDDDDEIDSDWLKNIYLSTSSYPDLIFLDYKIKNEKGEVLERRLKVGDSNQIPGTWAIKHSLFKQLNGYNEQLKFGENTELMFRARSFNPLIVYSSSLNFLYRKNSTVVGIQVINRLYFFEYMFETFPSLFLRDKKLFLLYLKNAGVASARVNDFCKARGFFLKAIVTQPYLLMNIARYLLTFFPPVAKRIWGRNQIRI